MATTYLAPGVYVEEVPSAQQPIAGVGTNTVGFIGIVEDPIICPVPISDEEYHKRVLTKENELKKVTKEQIQKTREDAIRDIGEIERKLVELNTALAAEKAKPEANGAEQRRLQGEIRTQEERKKKPTADRDTAQREFDNFDDIKTREAGRREVARMSVARYDIIEFKPQAAVADAKLCTNFNEYVKRFGPIERADGKLSEGTPVPFPVDDPDKEPGTTKNPGYRALTHAVYGFFKNGGTRCFVSRISSYDADEIRRALTDFESIDAIAIVAAPGVMSTDGTDLKDIWTKLVEHCETTKDRFAILDSPAVVEDPEGFINAELLTYDNPDNILPGRSKNAAYYFPWLQVIDPAKQLQDQNPARGVPTKQQGRICVPPSGHIAGIYARTDEERGVHKAPANAAVLGAQDLKYYISKQHQALLNPQGVNCIRTLNGNITVYGARTIGGDMNGEWKYVNVRRLFLFLAESIDEGTQWVVFEPNDQALWGKIRRNVSAFLTNVWRSGALFGSTPEEAFYVKCDAELNPPEVRDVGQVITEIGVAIVRPAEFVIFRITQSTGPRPK